MEEIEYITYVPRRVLELYEVAYAGTAETREGGPEAERISDEASDAEHYDAERYMLLYENQDIHGPIHFVIVDDPAFKRMQTVCCRQMH